MFMKSMKRHYAKQETQQNQKNNIWRITFDVVKLLSQIKHNYN